MPQITSQHVKQLLAARHPEDVFLTECRIPLEAYVAEGYMDAWAMKKSWRHPLATGYEIKVSRSDFLNDKKWVSYLAYCNEFYFVSPKGVIQVAEVPETAGLIWVTDTGNKLYTKKKAPYREINIDDLSKVYKSILMNRVNITSGSTIGGILRAHLVEHWEKMLREKEERRIYGDRLRGRIRRMYEDKIKLVEDENRNLKHEIESLGDIRERLRVAGVNVNSWKSRTEFIRTMTGEHLVENLRELRDLIETVLGSVEAKFTK